MPNGPIDPLHGKYALEGRIVTMGPAGVIPDGAIYVAAGAIAAVQEASAPPPPGFADAPRVRTAGSIYPGLIDLHNHLCYNAMPLWDVPQHYSNNGQWKNHPDYRRLITKPSQVLGRTAGVVEALVRWVECRCLLGGVTTSQGITLASASVRQYFQGIVRNVEQKGGPGLPAAGTSIPTPDAGTAPAYLERLHGHTCYLQHLSEGTDETARSWFLRLQIPDDGWAVTDAFVGIHSTALKLDDFRTVRECGGSMVWSPLSNYLLYGATADILAARESGILMGIGSDWGPSGSKNLLGELKVAWLTSQALGGVFSAQELVAMATCNGARILKWDGQLGTIEAGKRADLVVLAGQEGDDSMRLIQAAETALTLVVIDGVPRAGQKELMAPFGPGSEEIVVGNTTRVLNLAQETANPLVGRLTLTEATQRLRDAMHNLPTLAAELDSLGGAAFLAGSTDAEGVTWGVTLDFDVEDGSAFDLAGPPLASFVQPMDLPGITVADDPLFLPTLLAARNLPETIKKGLPALYGIEVPPPEGAAFLRRVAAEKVAEELLHTTRDLKTFLRTWGELTLEERKTIVDQAILLLEQNYVHLPLKRAMHAVDPVQGLRLLRRRLNGFGEGDLPPEIEFHDELSRIFNSLRDLHTVYRLPFPFRGRVAWLPFLVEECWEKGYRKYIVSKLVARAGPDSFRPGVEVLHWNGTPIYQAVLQNAERQAGSNEAARLARGLNSLTIRPLVAGLPPEEDWVTVRYRDLQGKVHEWTQEWLVFEPGTGVDSPSPEDLLTMPTALGLDAYTDEIQQVRKVFFGGPAVREEARAIAEGEYRAIDNVQAADGLPTYMPTVFRARAVETPSGTFGYVRIFTFNVSSAGEFVDEFVRLVTHPDMPDNGLVIDVRGNGGGLILAAERLLQVLTPRPVEPQRAQFINSPVNLQICQRYSSPPLSQSLDLSAWVESMDQAVMTGASYSLGYPITDPQSCTAIGQRYYGPIVLITDALCYSATDMFVAGFQDHAIGTILGVHENTGAGGANVWSHRLLCELLPPPSAYAPLPKGADLRVAMRRTVRVGPNAGGVVEDLGIKPDQIYRMTRQDVLGHNDDLLARAGEILAATPRVYRLKVTYEQRPGTYPALTVETRNMDRLDVLVDGRPRRSLDLVGDSTALDLQEIAGSAGNVVELELQGFDGGVLAARRREQVRRG
jgi:hypothetical protein